MYQIFLYAQLAQLHQIPTFWVSISIFSALYSHLIFGGIYWEISGLIGKTEGPYPNLGNLKGPTDLEGPHIVLLTEAWAYFDIVGCGWAPTRSGFRQAPTW